MSPRKKRRARVLRLRDLEPTEGEWSARRVQDGPVMTTIRSMVLRGFAFSLAFTLAFAPGGGAIAAATPETAVENRPPPGARTAPREDTAAREATSAETASYASRDEKAPSELAEFSGGDRSIIVITSTTLVIILLVILIVVLI
jgi:hypothetical protein